MTESELTILSGKIIALRLFDIANEVDLKLAQELWSQVARGASTRRQLMATPSKAVSFGVPPLNLELDPVPLVFGADTVLATASMRIYDFGIASVSLAIPIADFSWPRFSRRVNDVNLMIGPAAATDLWNGLVAQTCQILAPALTRPAPTPLQEDYLIAVVNQFDRPISAAAVQESVDLVPVLSGEERALSEGERRDLMRHTFSYYPDDLAVIAWDRAFLYDPQGGTDVIDVIEIANAQLLEMRAYDEMLDAELPRMHIMVGSARGFLAARRYAKLARRLYSLVGEVSELAERVENALQVTEDVYLARVYAAAIALFRVPNVSAAVDRKLAIIRDTYTALHQEAAGARAEILEIAIIALICLEVVLSLLRH
jgi:hypothetical protein